jgi:hypothetical protein
MAEFEAIRDELALLHLEVERGREQALLAGEAVRRSERALAESARTLTREDGDEEERLQQEVQSAREREREAGAELASLRDRQAQVLNAFEVFTDPREHLAKLSDRYPILLLPLRLETRFTTGAAGTPQLWVRVYPDTCLVDTFEPSLTEQEVDNAQAFWARVWRAAGDETLERAGWRELVAAHGSGRAAWIIRQYTPLNPAQKPVETDEADVHLIVAATETLPGEVAVYWEAAWHAGGDAAALEAAYSALEGAIGPVRARDVVEHRRPFNFDDPPPPPLRRDETRVQVTVVRFAAAEELETRRTSWSSPARIDLLPDKFLLVASPRTGEPVTANGRTIRTPLIASPDPNASPEEALKPVDDELQIPSDIAWMFDFDEAVDAGMAFRVDITPEQARDGFERVVVLGVRLGDSPEQGSENLARLLEHHLHSRGGLALLQQGTPTNNTEQGGAGYSFREDPDATFDVFMREQEQYDPLQPDPLLRRDGHWLADLLGLPHELVQRIPNAGGSDQSDARAMQIALWPGTLGYALGSLLAPVFSDEDIAFVRDFFTRYVTGRGPLPALRIGRQPYGILPTTAFGRIGWFDRGQEPKVRRLYEALRRIDDDWQLLVDQVSHIGEVGGDPHQILLDVLGLHPSSVECYPLQSESVAHKFYELSFFDFSMARSLLDQFPPVLPMTLLRTFGYAGEDVPDLLNKLFKGRQTPLTGPLVDDRPLSESDEIRRYAGDRNYIDWLADVAEEGIEALQQERGFDGGRAPTALLYLLLRHALQLGFRETALGLGVDAGLVQDASAMRREPAFVHVSEAAESTESGYALLFRAEERITGSAGLRLGDYIAHNILVVGPELSEQIQALRRLARLPTAKLERAFAEHIDCCAYRLDAWKMGLLTAQLELMRRPKKREDIGGDVVRVGPRREATSGIYLGAYGWLEPLRPRADVLTPADDLSDELSRRANRRDTAPLLRDPANAGLIHAPSVNHATTAAVLRNGYLANDGRLAVNLTSRRVRLALEIIEGMRNGQPLGALLGYRFERHVHDNGPLGVRDLIYPLRRAFPLAANQIVGTRTETGEAQESVAAMNVVDGRKLIEHVESARPPNATYPFRVDSLPRRDAEQERALTSALAHIRDVNDALADLVLAEGVHQAVSGNYERSAGVLDAFAKGNSPPQPDVVRTPRSGIGLTLRTAIHLSPNPPADPLPGIPLTPLARAEPAVNAWLRDRLPPPASVGCRITFTSRATDAEQSVFVAQQQLGLHPIDLLYRAQAAPEQALGDLDEHILLHVQANHDPRHDRPITILHTERVADRFSWFELQALLRSLRSVVASRPLQPADLMRANDSSKDQQAMVSLPRARIAGPRDDLRDTLLPTLDALAAALDDPAVSIDAALTQFAPTVARFAAYRLPQTGSAFAYEWRAGRYASLTEKLRRRVERWNERLATFAARIQDYDLLPGATPEAERLALLASAELVLSPKLTDPQPSNSGNYRNTVLVDRRAALAAKRDALEELVTVPRATLAALLDDADAELPLTEFDSDELDLAEDANEIARFRAQLAAAVAELKRDVAARLARVGDLLDEHDAAGDAPRRTQLLQDAARTLFGDDFQLVPHITLPGAAADELANAWQHSRSGGLTSYLTTKAGHEFPVDDWLHGIARVREKMHDWESIGLLGDGIPGAQTAELTPLQLPYRPGEPWLALEFPAEHEITSDRLLYTAHFAEPFDAVQPVCGLLVDEWTEVIPGTRETTGIAFHYDRPSSEPPQSWLLALAPSRDGAWSWAELLEAVNDTLDAAKQRAIEPAHIDRTAYGWFLPATTSAYTFPEISISNDLLRNRDIYAAFGRDEG